MSNNSRVYNPRKVSELNHCEIRCEELADGRKEYYSECNRAQFLINFFQGFGSYVDENRLDENTTEESPWSSIILDEVPNPLIHATASILQEEDIYGASKEGMIKSGMVSTMRSKLKYKNHGLVASIGSSIGSISTAVQAGFYDYIFPNNGNKQTLDSATFLVPMTAGESMIPEGLIAKNSLPRIDAGQKTDFLDYMRQGALESKIKVKDYLDIVEKYARWNGFDTNRPEQGVPIWLPGKEKKTRMITWNQYVQLKDFNLYDIAQHIKCRTLTIAGKYDERFDYKACERFAKKMAMNCESWFLEVDAGNLLRGKRRTVWQEMLNFVFNKKDPKYARKIEPTSEEKEAFEKENSNKISTEAEIKGLIMAYSESKK